MRDYAIKNRMRICSVLIFLAALLLAGCEKQAQQAVEAMPVEAVRVEKGSLNEMLFYVGDIKARDEAVVYPKVTGKIIEKLVKEGEAINKADILAYIDRDEIGFQFEKAPVESPIDGTVGNIYVDIGTSVSPQTPVGLVVNMDVVKVRINVTEKDLPKIKVGQPAKIKIDAYPDEVFQGVVERVSPVVNLASRTALAEITIPNSDYRLKPGMFARINILIGQKQGVLIIPRDAIIRENSSHYVFVIKQGNKVERRMIETGLNENNKFEVASGLSEGELVVTMGNTLLKEGSLVKMVE
jgi:membrane fusion protein (multidrug efflux system)